jgi:hypothetical protein
VVSSSANEQRVHKSHRHFYLERKLIYSTEELKLAMKLLLGQRAHSPRVRRTFFSGVESVPDDKFVAVNKDTIDWAYHVLDRMVFQPSWQIRFR